MRASYRKIKSSHCDTGATNGTMVPWIAGPLGKKANAGDHRLRVTFMAHSIPGAGINAPLGLPWLDTGVDWNLTCYHLGLLAVKAKFGFIPANLTYVFDGGDGNMSRALVLFAGALVGQGKFVSIELVRAFVGHGHGLSDGDIGHLSQKRSGYTVLTLQDFINKLLPKAFGSRLLASPLCAYQLNFKEILTNISTPSSTPPTTASARPAATRPLSIWDRMRRASACSPTTSRQKSTPSRSGEILMIESQCGSKRGTTSSTTSIGNLESPPATSSIYIRGRSKVCDIS